jgi:transposase
MKQESPAVPPHEPSFGVFVAIDWADQKHVWSLQAAGSNQREHGEIQHTPEAVEVWVGGLASRFPAQSIAVAVEQSRGALVFMLSKYEHLHIYPIHPRTAAQFRAALYPSGVKDDPIDANLLLDLLMHHRGHLRRLNPDTEQTRLVQQLVEARRILVNEKTRQSNRLTAKLKLYFPQILNWFDAVDSALVGALLDRWPTLKALQKARQATLRSFFTEHNCRNTELIEQRLEQIRHATPAIRDAAVIQSAVAMVSVLVALIATLRQGIARLDRQIEQAAAAHPDFAIFNSFPGAGPVLAPRLLAAFGSQRDRYLSAAEIQQFSGIAPVLVRSGKTAWVHYRWACPKFLRQTFQEWAGHSIGFCGWARIYYEQQRKHGAGHHAAVRALAFKWIRIAYRCWKDGIPYDDLRYLQSLRRRGSPLVSATAFPQENS